MAGPRTVFLHIGMPKTGSTAIQAACDGGRAEMALQGIHYPAGDRIHSERLALTFWNTDDARRLAGLRWHDGAAADHHVAAVRQAFDEDIARACPHLLLSAETLSDCSEVEVARLKAHLAPHFDRFCIMAYLREPLSWSVSAAQQATKWSGHVLEQVFDRPPTADFAARFGPWLKVFGEDVSFRPFVMQDVVADFSETLGLAVPLPTQDRLNEAVTHRSALLLSEINRTAPPFVEARHNPFRSFDLIEDARLPGRRFTLPRETVEMWQQNFARDRDWANSALGREVFHAPPLPTLGRDDWARGEANTLAGYAKVFLSKSADAQNARALRMLILAQKHREDRSRASQLLEHAWRLTTDRWTMGQIAEEALKQSISNREKLFSKLRLMRRIEAPEASDPPLVIGNPFDRPWRMPICSKSEHGRNGVRDGGAEQTTPTSAAQSSC